MKHAALLIVLTVLITGCPPTTNTIDTYTGREGIEISFLENSPPSTVYDNQPFFLIVEAQNKGAYSVNDSEDVEIQIDYETFYFENTEEDTIDTTYIVDLAGKSLAVPRGERITFDVGKLQVADRSRIGDIQEVQTQIRARTCYPYRTELSESICIENDYYDVNTASVCDGPDMYRFPEGSGAPIMISEVQAVFLPAGTEENEFETTRGVFGDSGVISGTEKRQVVEQNLLLQPVFQLKLRNPGEGTASYQESGQCDAEATNDAVKVQAELGGEPLDCQPEIVRLQDGKGVTECQATSDNLRFTNSNYENILRVTADYDYTETFSKRVTVRHRPTFQ